MEVSTKLAYVRPEFANILMIVHLHFSIKHLSRDMRFQTICSRPLHTIFILYLSIFQVIWINYQWTLCLPSHGKDVSVRTGTGSSFKCWTGLTGGPNGCTAGGIRGCTGSGFWVCTCWMGFLPWAYTGTPIIPLIPLTQSPHGCGPAADGK